ncbi:MAG: maleylpyruvate isomerase N-terminal domain-containing protein [Actinomycetota bacterium]|nr:maleylpyruvate isomerase N-terminal domain-containing protein [Actinomycetota bacterium]
MTPGAEPHQVFASAVGGFTELARLIPDSAWDGPGLGEWTVRDLVGHTSRALTTVSTYLQHPTDRAADTDAVGYYVAVREIAAGLGSADVAERGRQAGRDLGEHPVAAIEALAARALADVDDAADADPVLEVIGGLRIRLGAYLPTRTFELAVHCLDIAGAVGIDRSPPAAVLADAAALAARVGVALGAGPAVLLTLTGRATLPAGFTVV